MLHLDPITSPLSMPIQPLSRWRPHANTINAIVVLPDGDHVVTSDEDGRLLVSSLTQAKVVYDLSGHYGPVNTMALTPNGRYLITGSDDTTVRVWDIRSWETVHTLRGHSGFIRSVAANDSIIVSGAEDKLINVWDLESGECKKQFTGHEEDVWAVAISPDGTRLASSSLDNALWIRDINEGRIVHRLIEGGDIVVKLGGSLYQSIPNTRGGHESAVKRLIFVDSDMLLSCAEEIIRWDLKDGARSYEVIAKHVLPINDMALHPADNLLAFASGSVMVYDYKMGERRYVLSDTDAQQRVLSFIPRRTRIAAGTRDGELVVWSIDTAPPIESGVHSTYVYHSGITCTVDGAVLAVTIDGHNGMRLWNVADGTLVKAVDQYPCIAGKFFTFSPSGRTLITSFGENLLVWDTITGNLRHSLRFTDKKRPELISGALILNEKKALVGTKGNLAIWDLTGEGTPEVFDGITSDVETIATTSDQRLVYTIGSFAPKDADDGISLNSVNHLQCWNIPGRKLVWDQPAAKKTDGIIGMPLHFCCIAISPDNRQIGRAHV
jgi:WD40 repeat protein